MPKGERLADITVHPGSAALSAVGKSKFTSKNQWHQENVTFFPKNKSDFEDLNKCAQEFVFKGYGPKSPILDDTDSVLTIGSCFADRLRNWLRNNGKESSLINVPEGLGNSFAVRQYLEWALTGNRSSDAYWYDNDKELGAYQWQPDKEQMVFFGEGFLQLHMTLKDINVLCLQ